MKKTLITLLLVIASTTTMFAPPNNPPLPANPPSHGIGDTPSDDPSAPIGTSTVLLLVLGGSYALCRYNKKDRVRQE